MAGCGPTGRRQPAELYSVSRSAEGARAAVHETLTGTNAKKRKQRWISDRSGKCGIRPGKTEKTADRAACFERAETGGEYRAFFVQPAGTAG